MMTNLKKTWTGKIFIEFFFCEIFHIHVNFGIFLAVRSFNLSLKYFSDGASSVIQVYRRLQLPKERKKKI